MVMKLNDLRDNKGARHARKRKGRGIGSGLGKTAGRGHKGQKSRSGVSIKGFEGGQMPIYRRLPKRGFTNIFRKTWAIVNLGAVQRAINEKKITDNKIISSEILHQAGLVRANLPVRLLAKGKITSQKITFEVAAASKSALEAVTANGGQVKIIPFDKKIKPKSETKTDRRRVKKVANKKLLAEKAARGECKPKYIKKHSKNNNAQKKS